jgi:hypothetical protein
MNEGLGGGRQKRLRKIYRLPQRRGISPGTIVGTIGAFDTFFTFSPTDLTHREGQARVV